MSVALMASRASVRIPASAGGPSAWLPTDLGSDLALWLDADDASTITASSSVVTTWADKSGNGRDATTTVSADKPSTVANVQNSRAIMRFDNDRLNASVAANIFDNGIQITVVCVKTGSANSLESAPAVRTVGGVGRGLDRYNVQLCNNASGFCPNSTVDMKTATSWMVLSTRTNGSGGAEWKDGTSVLSHSNAYSYQDTATQVQVGRRDNDGSAFRGDVGEIVVTQYLSTTNRQKLEGYLAWRWGLEGNLPNDHPYKSSAP